MVPLQPGLAKKARTTPAVTPLAKRVMARDPVTGMTGKGATRGGAMFDLNAKTGKNVINPTIRRK